MITEEVKDLVVKSISLSCNKGEKYNLKILIEFTVQKWLYFDSFNFELITKKERLPSFDWIKLNYTRSNISILNIKEDESCAYFIEFSSSDILYIYQNICDLETWWQECKIVEKGSLDFNDVYAHMNEEWIDKL